MAFTTTQRGYGYRHQQERRRWATVVAAGQASCVHCGRWIAPGSEWHLDHNITRTAYRGPAHAWCNRSEGGKRGRAKQVGQLRRRAAMWTRW